MEMEMEMKKPKLYIRHDGRKKQADEASGHERNRVQEIDDTRAISFQDETNLNSEQDNEEPYGLKMLDEGTNPTVDIIAVHGLGGHWKRSWLHHLSGVFWLQDLLPKKISQARIFSYSYNSIYIMAEDRTISKDTIRKHGVKLVQSVIDEREGTEAATRSIVIIAHSLGGIVVKSALLYSQNTHESHLKRLAPFKICTKSILLIGTPQQGADFPSVAAAAFIISSDLSKYDWEHHDALKKESVWLEEQSQEFLPISKDFEIICFRETQETLIAPGQRKLIVPESSAKLPGSVDVECIAIEGDHRNVAKFAHAESGGFIEITERLKSIINVLEEEKAIPITPLKSLFEHTTVDIDDTSCLNSLSFLGIYFQLNNVQKAQPGTCKWILGHSEYREWVEEDRGIFWIQGKPGSGKSTLMKFLLQHWGEHSFKENAMKIHFFFHGRGSSLQKSELGMFRSILHQLLYRVPDARAEFQAAFKKRTSFEGEHEKDWAWDCNDLRDFFTNAAKKVVQEYKLHIVIDAIDEACNETENISLETSGDHAAHSIVSYLHALNDELSDSPFPVSICLSCRYLPNIATTRGYRLAVEEENIKDISDYVAANLAPETLSKISPDDEIELKQLREEIISGAGGNFQWTCLVVSRTVMSYSNGSTLQQLRLLLKKTPRELKDIYEQILMQLVQGDLKHESVCLMEWVWLAERPLKLEELDAAMLITEPNLFCNSCFADKSSHHASLGEKKQYIQVLSGGLIEIQDSANKEEDNIVYVAQFIHQSVSDFFQTSGLRILQSFVSKDNSLSQGLGHDRLSKACLNYIKVEATKFFNESISEDDRILTSTSSIPSIEMPMFCKYAANNVFIHAKKAESQGVPQLHLLTDVDTNFLNLWMQICKHCELGFFTNHRQGLEYRCTLLHIASAFNLISIAEVLLQIGTDPETTGDNFTKALHYAALYGYVDIVRLLLKNSLNIDSKDGSKSTALIVAAANRHEEIVDVLLKAGADANMKNEDGEIALYNASYRGSAKMVRLLFKHNSDTSTQGGRYGTALEAASFGGCVVAIQLLLDKGANVNIQGGEYGNALQAASASYSNSTATTRLLLDRGADVNAQSGEYGYALQVASYRGNIAAMQLLLDRGADVNAQGGEYSTALQAASYKGNIAVMELLLDRGADVNAQEEYCRTALQAASYSGNVEAMELLLDRGADVDAQGGEHGTALQIVSALYSNSTATMKLLLDRGADINAQSGDYGNALQVASYRGNIAAAQLLLDRGANINAQGGKYGNALQAASWGGSLELMQQLLDRGADVNAQGGEYGTPLQATSYSGNIAAMQLLLDKGANVNIHGGKYSNALQAASMCGSVKAIRLLLDMGADVNTQGGYYGTALQAASDYGSMEAMQLLLDRGADVNAQGGEHGSALQAASASASYDQSIAVMQLLLDRGADVDIQAGEYSNALQAASYRGNIAAMQLLLDRGADVNAPGGYYNTALQAASSNSVTAMQLLLDWGADVNTQGGHHGNALEAVSYRGSVAGIQLLLERGANINAQGGEHGNALQAASYNGGVVAMKLLLDRGADVNAQGGKYGTALQAAVIVATMQYGTVALMQLLLDRGADVNMQGGEYGSALRAARVNKMQDAIDLLLAHGAIDTAEDNQTETDSS